MRWLSRLLSREVRALTVLLDAERVSHRAALRRIGALAAERVALKRQVASTQARLAESIRERQRLADELAKYEQGVIPS